MFWNLLLAHFAGDFLLQSDWMVKNRDKFWVLTLHSSIHLGLMLLITGASRSEFWPVIGLIALIHLGQDALKVFLVRKDPGLLKAAFILDQLLHILLLWIFVSGFQMDKGNIITQQPALLMIAIAYLAATFVWYITEKTLFSTDREYVQHIDETKFSRMISRAGLVSIYLIVQTWAFPGLAGILINPYDSTKYRQRAILTDIVVSLVGMAFLFWALG